MCSLSGTIKSEVQAVGSVEGGELCYWVANWLRKWDFSRRWKVATVSHHIETTDAGLDGVCIREINVYHTNL